MLILPVDFAKTKPLDFKNPTSLTSTFSKIILSASPKIKISSANLTQVTKFSIPIFFLANNCCLKLRL